MVTQSKSRRKQVPPRLTVEEVRDGMKDALNRAEFQGERLVITRHGKPAAALVSIADLEKIEAA